MGAVSRQTIPGYISPDDAAAKSGIPVHQIRRMLNSNDLAGVKFGSGRRSLWLVSESAVEKLREATDASR